MEMPKILNQAQARALVDAMCALNNVCASIDRVVMEGKDGEIQIENREFGGVKISAPGYIEYYESQNDFAKDYGID